MPKKYALRAMDEIQILGQLSSPNIVKYIDSFVCGSKVNIVMEHCEDGDLEKLIYQDQKKKALPESKIWRYFIQICIGVYDIHR